MPECPRCERFFEVAYRRCPRCDVHEASLDDFLNYWAKRTEAQLESGFVLLDVFDDLIDNGLSDAEALEIVNNADAQVSQRIRTQGFKRIVCGTIGLLLAGAGWLLFLFTATSFDWLVGGLLYMAVFVGIFGVAAFGSGVRSLISGRDQEPLC